MEITSHLSWRWGSGYCSSNNTITTTFTFDCQYGCQGSISVPFLCIEYSVEDDWSYLEGHKAHVFNASDINTVTVGRRFSDLIYPDWRPGS